MLTRLIPDQIAKLWDIIRYAVEQSLPPIVGEHPDKMNRILASALSGGIEVWVSYDKSSEPNRFEGVVLTKVLYDDSSNTKNLLIYCLYGYDKVDSKSWMNGLIAILKYAKSRGCSYIIAYTEVPYLVNLTKKLGGEAKYTFLSFNVDEFVQKLNELK